ncbi:hypothetical protein C8R43DRAFT_1137911 [Mycena crocata]|nr:hypothetical protein C8R43DRAFT_1137911 [Mycena crocata]
MVALDDTDADTREMEELGALLHTLSLPGDDPRPRPVTPPPRSVPVPRTPSRPAPAHNVPRTASRPPRSPATSTPSIIPASASYHIRTPEKTGFTSSWSRAAAETQGVPHALAQRVVSKPAHGKRSKKGGIAVFHGTFPGAYPDWATAEPFVKGIPGALYKGYRTFQAAQAAFEYANSKTWTRVCVSRNAPRSQANVASSLCIPSLPQPIGYNDGPNPLHDDDDASHDGRWYIVYAGITPGVYQSSLECSLNTVGLSCATYDSVIGRENAIHMYQDAFLSGDVKVLTHPYTS